PILMPEGLIVVKEEPTETEPVQETSEENGNGDRVNFRKIFQNRKKLSVRKRDRKQRLNRQLRKAMTPKNALMSLNEVGGMDISDCVIEKDTDDIFVATVTINSLEYVGKGLSKISAKNAACEKAWRDYILARMTPKKKTAIDGTLEQTDATNGEADPPDSDAPNVDLPMMNLASYAIHKLFGEWEREGYEVTSMNATNATPPGRSELPPNWEAMSPTSLLAMMRPGTVFKEYGTSGKDPKMKHHVAVVADDLKFSACGRSKKFARYNVAVAACNILFGTNFDGEVCK
ncbi:hypothetical protein KR018_010850, partial [Drosophila ironensis]